MVKPLPKYYECGICGHFHRLEWDGDCREDAERFTMNALDYKHGHSGNWEEVPMPTWDDAGSSEPST